MKRFALEHLFSLGSKVASISSDGRDRRLPLPSVNHLRDHVGTKHFSTDQALG